MKEKYTWLHIGLGSFHRAHQAWYLHRLLVGGMRAGVLQRAIFVTMPNMLCRR
ncbi:D-arabinitol 4-dehydrogenase [Escherichia coli]|nr:D-arabinitol 4-dehydrogenase [Escherichia coli]VTR17126.1 D-arabinitol 4-dehydrogenase [Escherichia coli]